MTVSVARHSRLRFSTLLVANNGTEDIEWFDLPRPKQAKPDPTDTVYTTSTIDRIDRIAFSRYTDTVLWDVIADINLLLELPQELITNTIIRLPSKNRVLGDLRG